MSKDPKKLKRAVVKEELVSICGDFIDAIILNQFIYWSDRIKDFDKYIAEEVERASRHGIEKNMTLTSGWIYKTSEELANETMLAMSASSMRRHIKTLTSSGYLDERQNPEYKWDQTKQYRVNLTKIQIALIENGYTLEGYPLPILKIENADFKIEIQSSKIETQDSKIEMQYQRLLQRLPQRLLQRVIILLLIRGKRFWKLSTGGSPNKFTALGLLQPQQKLKIVPL